jgi:hypothetical protein
MFNGDYRYYGIHASMTDELLIANGGIFDTVYDVVFAASIVGFLKGETSKDSSDRKNDKTIFQDKLSREIDKTNFISRTMILANPDIDSVAGKPNRVERALKRYNESEVANLNKKYFEGYAFRGIEILHEEYQNNKSKKGDIVTFMYELIGKYANSDSNYESIHSIILNLAKMSS